MRTRGTPLALLATLLAGCSFSKDPYLFTNLGDAQLISIPDGSAVADSGAPDGGVELDASAERDASASEDAGPSGDAGSDGGVDAGPRFRTGNAIQLVDVAQGLVGSGAGFLPSEGAPRTIEAWVRGASAPRSGRIFGYGSELNGFTLLLVVSEGEGGLILSDGVNVAVAPRTPALADEAWHHVAVTMTASVAPEGPIVTFYLDGVETHRANKGGNDVLRADSQTLIMGGIPSDAIGFSTLLLDEVRLWSIARSGEQIARDRATIIDKAPGLVGYWAMDELGAGPGIFVPNRAVATSTTAAAPGVFTQGGVVFVESTAF